MDAQKKILLVEDEAPLLKALSNALINEGFTILKAKDGKEGLDIALHKHPDIIVLDILMPQMDGMEMLKNLRENQWGKTTPVILLTNVNPDGDAILKSITKYGPAYYLIKSDVTLVEIIEKIKEVLSSVSRSQPSDSTS